jgi:hypothetical protein
MVDLDLRQSLDFLSAMGLVLVLKICRRNACLGRNQQFSWYMRRILSPAELRKLKAAPKMSKKI